jgi:hypothetical protein
MDRAPLDAFAFAPPSDYQTKAKALYDVACVASTGSPQPFASGALILLTGRADDLLDRQRWRGRGGDLGYIEKQQDALLKVYGTSPGVRIVDTKGLSIDAVVKRVSRLMHLEAYKEYSMDERLQQFRAASA